MQALLNVEVTGEPFELSKHAGIYLIGNGGSCSIAQHIAVDLIKNGYDAQALTDPAVMSMFANDHGWDEVFAGQLLVKLGAADPDDTLIAISSSGQSENIVSCVQYRRTFTNIITLSGFKPDNRLRKLGHVNYYVPSSNYGVVEITHLAILHSIVNPGI